MASPNSENVIRSLDTFLKVFPQVLDSGRNRALGKCFALIYASNAILVDLFNTVSLFLIVSNFLTDSCRFANLYINQTSAINLSAWIASCCEFVINSLDVRKCIMFCTFQQRRAFFILFLRSLLGLFSKAVINRLDKSCWTSRPPAPPLDLAINPNWQSAHSHIAKTYQPPGVGPTWRHDAATPDVSTLDILMPDVSTCDVSTQPDMSTVLICTMFDQSLVRGNACWARRWLTRFVIMLDVTLIALSLFELSRDVLPDCSDKYVTTWLSEDACAITIK